MNIFITFFYFFFVYNLVYKLFFCFFSFDRVVQTYRKFFTKSRVGPKKISKRRKKHIFSSIHVFMVNKIEIIHKAWLTYL